MHRTYGWYRLEILASLANTVLLFAVAEYVSTKPSSGCRRPRGRLDSDDRGRRGRPRDQPDLLPLLQAGAKESLNLRGAYLEVVADAVGSVGVLIGATIIAMTSWYWVDSVIAVGIGLFILPRAYRLGRDSLRILVESAPPTST